MAHELELGLDTFGDVTVDDDGHRRSEAQVIRDVVEEAVLADQVGIDLGQGKAGKVPHGRERLRAAQRFRKLAGDGHVKFLQDLCAQQQATAQAMLLK